MPRFDIQQILIRVLVLTFSLSIHEYAHARTAYKLGDDTAARQGRLTLSPLKHLDLYGAIAFVIAGFGWAKPVPVNPANFSRDKVKDMRFGMLRVAIAGPASNLIIAFFANLILQLLYFILILTGNLLAFQSNPIFNIIFLILSSFYFSNIFLALFNMLPIPPLDGSKVLGAFLPNRLYYQYMAFQRYSGIVMLILIFFGGGILGRIIRFISIPIDWLLSTPVNLLFNLLINAVN